MMPKPGCEASGCGSLALAGQDQASPFAAMAINTAVTEYAGCDCDCDCDAGDIDDY